MRRLLMMVPIAALAVTGFVPAQAADPPEKTPIVIACVGTGGYEGDYWRADSKQIARPACTGWAPDTAKPLGAPPPPPDPNPTTPDDYFWWLEKWMGPSTPVATGSVQLTGSGDFACGSGSLERAVTGKFGENILWTHQGPVHQSSWRWMFDWSAAFADGVGELEGTATRNPIGSIDPQETRSLSGRLFVNDGAAYGQCDDSAGSSQVVAVFVLE